MAFQEDSIFWVEVEKVVPNPFQPRREFDEEKLAELADSIRMYGVLQPLTVTRKEVHNDDGSFRTQYELIAGERRWRASKKAGVAQVPVIIRSGDQTEQEKLELAIIENLQREDLNAVDRALAFKQLADSFNLSHAQVAKKVGRSREYVSNSIRLLALPEHMLDGLKRGDISEGHARTLLMLKDKPEEMEVVYREILLKKLSVREVERISRKIANDKVRKKEFKNTDAHLIEIEKEFTDTLGTRVQILKTDFGGKLTIDYFSDEDLEQLLVAMKKQHARINAAAAMSAATISEQAEQAGETVIQEMDELSESIAKLEAATGLRTEDGSETRTESAAADAEPVTQSDSQQPVAEPTPSLTEHSEDIATTQTDAATTQEVAQPEAVTEDTSVTPEPAATSEAPHQAPVSAITATETAASSETDIAPTAQVPQADTPETAPAAAATESNPEPAVATQETTAETESQQPTASEPETDAVTSQPIAESNAAPAATSSEPNSSLRARLEAELARLDALENTSENSATGTADEAPAATTDQPEAPAQTQTEHEPAPRKDDDDDSLYSIRNFSL